MQRNFFLFTGAAVTLAVASFLAACGGTSAKARPAPYAPNMQEKISNAMYPTLRGTAGEFAAFVDSNPTLVEGYGIVANLPHTGSGDADQKIREFLINQLVIDGVGLRSAGTQDISPEAILSSDQISVVEVRGIIPPLARRGTTFDLYINALPNSGTTSLENGLLWSSDLKQIGLTVGGNDTRVIAKGRGPVFIPNALQAAVNPAVAKSEDAPRALRTGRVIAGGVCAEDRPARLQVYVPDAARTLMIERAINSRFPGREKTADAQDQSVILIKIPADFSDNPGEFVELIKHLYLTGDTPGFNQKKAREIIEALADPSAPHLDLGLALQGLGRSILPDYIQPNYTSSNPNVRFWCARAGACMQDVGGMMVLEEIVKDPASPLRRQAILAIIQASRGRETNRATLALYEMLRSYNTDDRILAYHALLAIRSRAVLSYSVGKKFIIDIIPADSPPLIYVLQSDSPRIAFIGRPLELAPGSLFISKDKALTVSVDLPGEAASRVDAQVVTAASLGAGARGGAARPTTTGPAAKPEETATLYWHAPIGNRTAHFRTVPRLPDIVARATWIPEPDPQHPYDVADPSREYIGASYQRITEMLATMCAEKTIDATFIAQSAPDLITSPADMALSGRSETSTKIVPPAPPVPAGNTPEAGAPPKP